MFGFLRKRSKASDDARFEVPAGQRVYAIGDIHGCRWELERLLDQIEADLHGWTGETHLIFVGDLVDRGPDSAGVIARLRKGPLPGTRHSFIIGNHEEAMLQVWDGHGEVIAGWLRFGGIQTLESYGLTRAEVFRLGIDLPQRMHAVIPAEDIDFVRGFQNQVRSGDYLFVHAGIRPGIDLEEQDTADLRWIREDFLKDERDHGVMVVHGHTISSAPQERRNRIGIDTGCYSTGRLTALVLEGAERRFLQTPGR